MLEYLKLTWTEVEEACKDISDVIRARNLMDHSLIGISRGGLVPLRILSDQIAAQQVSTLTVRFYEDIGKTWESPDIVFPVQGDVRGKNVILVDDISDTGKSLIAAREHLIDKGAKDIVTATVCVKPHTSLKPDIYAIESSQWVIFPWEVQETVRRIVGSAGAKNEAEAELKKTGIDFKDYNKTLDSIFGGK
jgi:hypoxanthine phosphoribosyltransferase